MKKLFLTIAAAAVVLSVSGVPAKAEETKIGYVDLQRALSEVEEGKAAKDRLQKLYAQKQQELDRRQQELKSLKDQMDKEDLMRTDEAKKQRMAELQQKFVQLQQTFYKEQQELNELEGKLTKEIFDKMRAILTEIGKREGFSLILEISDNRLLYAKPHMDLTNELIRAYDAKYKLKKGK